MTTLEKRERTRVRRWRTKKSQRACQLSVGGWKGLLLYDCWLNSVETSQADELNTEQGQKECKKTASGSRDDCSLRSCRKCWRGPESEQTLFHRSTQAAWLDGQIVIDRVNERNPPQVFIQLPKAFHCGKMPALDVFTRQLVLFEDLAGNCDWFGQNVQSPPVSSKNHFHLVVKSHSQNKDNAMKVQTCFTLSLNLRAGGQPKKIFGQILIEALLLDRFDSVRCCAVF